MPRLRFWLPCLLLAACMTIPSPAERRAAADALAQSKSWQASVIPTGTFDLVAYLPVAPASAGHLTIYIEGDGLAWITGVQVSPDPTPRDPLALRLALAQPEGAAAYLGRPCQYGDAEATNCSSRYWTSHRFAPEVVAASDRAIDVLKQRFSATRLSLVGYSGGGAVAALVAARRTDVERLVTIAGNLDPLAWTTYQRVQPLTGSLSPISYVEKLSVIPQWHYVGAMDDNITPFLIQGFAEHFPANQRPVVRVESGFDHRCCWAEQWPRLWQESLAR